MQSFDISSVAILKIMLAGAFSYIVLPALLVIRDLLLQKAIKKWIITNKLIFAIKICESDRWFLNNRYNKSTSVSYGKKENVYKIDNKEVTQEEFMEYEKNYQFHLNRFESADSDIALKHNLITWLTRHYKQADGGNPIPKLRKEYYDFAQPTET